MERPRPKKGTPPRWLKPMNRVFMGLQRAGLGMKELDVLTVVGRRTGRPRRTPVTLMDFEGQRYVVSGFPGSDWAANARAAGLGTLSRGKLSEEVRLVELSAEEARPVLRAFPAQVPSGVEMMTMAGVVSSGEPAEFERLAGRCAVFRIEAAV